MYKVSVNDQYNFEIEAQRNLLKVDGKEVILDAVTISDTDSHLIYQDKSYNVEIIDGEPEDKTIEVKVNGHIYSVAIADQFDLLLKQLGMDNLNSTKVREIKAPMPGLVLNILVAVGQEIKKGDNLLILEAMKMENIIKSTTDGVVKAILVDKGDKVEKNAILLQFS